MSQENVKCILNICNLIKSDFLFLEYGAVNTCTAYENYVLQLEPQLCVCVCVRACVHVYGPSNVMVDNHPYINTHTHTHTHTQTRTVDKVNGCYSVVMVVRSEV